MPHGVKPRRSAVSQDIESMRKRVYVIFETAAAATDLLRLAL